MQHFTNNDYKPVPANISSQQMDEITRTDCITGLPMPTRLEYFIEMAYSLDAARRAADTVIHRGGRDANGENAFMHHMTNVMDNCQSLGITFPHYGAKR